MLHYRMHRDPESSHQQIGRLLRELGREPILDVGCAQGTLGQLLRGSGLEIDGIEPNTEWAEQASQHYSVVQAAGIEQVLLPASHYDVIVCADVLEHVPNPLDALGKLRRAARDDALFIVSLPNVSHIAVRVLMLAGRFPQMERGILDRTHLHFYTRDTSESMLAAAGLRIERVLATGVPLEEIWPSGPERRSYRAAKWLQGRLVSTYPRLFGFQWIYTATGTGSAGTLPAPVTAVGPSFRGRLATPGGITRW